MWALTISQHTSIKPLIPFLFCMSPCHVTSSGWHTLLSSLMTRWTNTDLLSFCVFLVTVINSCHFTFIMRIPFYQSINYTVVVLMLLQTNTHSTWPHRPFVFYQILLMTLLGMCVCDRGSDSSCHGQCDRHCSEWLQTFGDTYSWFTVLT